MTAFFQKFYKKKKPEKSVLAEKKEEKKKQVKEKTEKPLEKKMEEKQAQAERPILSKRKTILAPFVLKSPQITEKSSKLQEKNCYIFKVYNQATKPEIKKAVEERYNVKVAFIRTINVPRKRKRLGRSVGWQKGYKKAMIGLEKGQSIEITPR